MYIEKFEAKFWFVRVPVNPKPLTRTVCLLSGSLSGLDHSEDKEH